MIIRKYGRRFNCLCLLKSHHFHAPLTAVPDQREGEVGVVKPLPTTVILNLHPRPIQCFSRQQWSKIEASLNWRNKSRWNSNKNRLWVMFYSSWIIIIMKILLLECYLIQYMLTSCLNKLQYIILILYSLNLLWKAIEGKCSIFDLDFNFLTYSGRGTQ